MKYTDEPIAEQNLFLAFKKNWESQHCWKKGDRFFLACSGGVDSVVLAHLLFNSGVEITLLHCNFHLRGAESDRDELFVTNLAKSLNCPLLVRHFDTREEMKRLKMGLQETARHLRYKWFEEVLNETKPISGNRWLITAHHADDQVETVIMNFFRGTGMTGLLGMPFRRGNIIRPLLFADRKSILEFALTYGISWVEDSSNTDIHYTRNLIRQVILPAIEKVFPNATENVMTTSKHLRDVQQVYANEINKMIDDVLEKKEDHWGIPVKKLIAVKALNAVVYELFKTFGFSSAQVEGIINLMSASTGKFICSDTHRVLKNRDWLLIHPLNIASQQMLVIDYPGNQYHLNGRNLSVLITEQFQHPETASNQAWLDADLISFPLLIRPIKAGDYFYPLGMRKKKKIARFLTDLKKSRQEKELQWVVESEKKIVWVIGLRIDDRFKMTEKTKRVLLLKWE